MLHNNEKHDEGNDDNQSGIRSSELVLHRTLTRMKGIASSPKPPRHKPRMPLSIAADDQSLDVICRDTLRKLHSIGCTKAGTPYSLEQFQVTEKELRYLQKYGLVNVEASALLHPVLQSYVVQKAGADVGKITVVLNVALR